MKKLLLFFVFLTASLSGMLYAQAPLTLSFQGIAQDSAGLTVASRPIKLRFNIRHNASNGTVQFSEVRSALTNATGMFSVELGSPGFISRTGTLTGVSWGTGTKFLQVEMDVNNGTSYKPVSNQQLFSVPFAKFASTAQTLSADGKINPSQIAPGSTAGVNLPIRFDGTKWTPAPAYTPAGTLLFPLAASTNLATGNAMSIGSSSSTALKLSTQLDAMQVSASNGTAVNITSPNGLLEAFLAKNLSPGGTALDLKSASGAALSCVGGTAWNDFALELFGKIKIAGGNTNPTANAVLTCDASGNARWVKDEPFAFGGFSGPQVVNANPALFTAALQTVKNGGFGNAPVFTVPANGVYALSVKSRVKSQAAGATYDLGKSRVKENSILVRVERNGVLVQTMNELVRTPEQAAYVLDANLDSFFQLRAGDVVKVECKFQFDYDGTMDPFSLELLDIKGALVIHE